MNTKSLRVEIKNADKGEVTAVIATFDVVDEHGDVTVPGAFTDGAETVISAYGHSSWEGRLPVGKGAITSTGTEAVFSGQFFDTADGRDTFEVVKALGRLQEWSYGYTPRNHSFGEHDGTRVRFLAAVDVHEISPVLIGAGVNTRTLTTKSASTFGQECEAVLAALTALTDRAADVMAMRRQKGKELGVESVDLLRQVAAELTRVEGLLGPSSAENPARIEQLRYLRSVVMRS